MADVERELLFERLMSLGRLAENRAAPHGGLSRMQWTALRFFSMANSQSRTASGFAAYSRLSPASVSEIVDQLVNCRLMARKRGTKDRRVVRLDLTIAGRSLMDDSPGAPLRAALDALPDAHVQPLATAMEDIAWRLSQHNQLPLFGPCVRCAHRRPKERSGPSLAGFVCERFDCPIAPADLSEFCIHFMPRP